jgi:hypothetical protein
MVLVFKDLHISVFFYVSSSDYAPDSVMFDRKDLTFPERTDCRDWFTSQSPRPVLIFGWMV